MLELLPDSESRYHRLHQLITPQRIATYAALYLNDVHAHTYAMCGQSLLRSSGTEFLCCKLLKLLEGRKYAKPLLGLGAK